MRRHPISWIGKFNVIKMALVPKLHLLRAIPNWLFIEIGNFYRNWQTDPEVQMQGTQNSQNSLGGLTLPNLKTYHKATVV